MSKYFMKKVRGVTVAPITKKSEPNPRTNNNTDNSIKKSGNL